MVFGAVFVAVLKRLVEPDHLLLSFLALPLAPKQALNGPHQMIAVKQFSPALAFQSRIQEKNMASRGISGGGASKESGTG